MSERSAEDRALQVAVIEDWLAEASKAYNRIELRMRDTAERKDLSHMLYCLLLAQRSMLEMLTAAEGGVRR